MTGNSTKSAGLGPEAFGIYKRLLSYARPYWKIIAGSAFATAIYSVSSGVIPMLMLVTTNGLIGDEPTPVAVDIPAEGLAGNETIREWVEDLPVAGVPLFLLVIFAVRGTTDFLAIYGLNWVGRSVIRKLRTQLFTHYLLMPTSYFDRQSTGNLISRLTYNTEQVSEAITSAVVTIFRDSLTIVVLFVVMIWLSPQLTLLICIIAPTVAFLVNRMSKAFRRYSSRIQTTMGDATRIVEQSLRGHRVIKIFEGQEQESENFNQANWRNFRLNNRLVAARAAGDALTQYAVAVGIAAVIFVIFSGWVGEGFDAGVFVAFIFTMGQLLAPLKRLINVNMAMQRGVAGAESVFETLDERTESNTGTFTIERARGDVRYRNVSFGYDPEKGHVLRNIDVEIAAGSTVAFVGRSGSGKSSLVSLLPRFYDVDDGAVELDGRDIREYELHNLRRQISLVSQDIVLFDDTIASNIAYGSLGSCSREAVEKAADAAHVTEFARLLPEGLDTQVGEGGSMLSGGQRQRVAIARALLKDAPVLILDEATSALDTESERVIQDALEQLMQGRTTLVIAHRLSTIEKADRIIVMSEGAIVESGTHAELIAVGGHYSALHTMQFDD